MGDDEDLDLAHRMADLAGRIAMSDLAAGGHEAERKSDGSPVTPTDRRIERELRALIAHERPRDAFTGEEFGDRGSGPRRWIVDAVDGTRSFLAGEPEWGTLIALTHDHRVRLGLVIAPALGRRWWAMPGEGAWTAVEPWPPRPGGSARALSVTATARLERASVGIWPPPQRITDHARRAAAALADRSGRVVPACDWTGHGHAEATPAKPSTGSGTCHGGLLVATGRLDAFLLVGAGPWDVAALVPIVREAGGSFSDLAGGDRFDTGAALFGNTRLHAEALHAVRSAT
ncbi:inositol monophosphatase [Nocardiopsis sp. TSRI0078]|uniref:inositol monophosphatase family protein n=1 Tax=unclassified Nocardiopsis TaxID=2649073 RepID=UPI00093BC3FA|nr:inositol monophosphatase family protein [Nocardiopsis sp. TSRI0078]OKI22873.1 inositol monophosphatase [Nocardiopsis sp. TSRI0078]